MTSADRTDSLMVEILRTQETLKAEFQTIRELLQAHDTELSAIRARLEQFEESARFGHATSDVFTTLLPHGLMPQGLDDAAEREAARSIKREIPLAFYPERSPYLLDAPYVGVRRLHDVDLKGHTLAVLSTPAWEYSDAFLATEAACSIELQLHSVNGPISATRWVRGEAPTVPRRLTYDIESWPDALDAADTLWIPDPHLTSLVLRCVRLPEKICTRIRHQWVFSIDTEAWAEDQVRALVHRAGFTEIRRLSCDESTAYTTRRHESRGFVVIDQRDEATGLAPTLYLLASKFPSASFRVAPAGPTIPTDERGRDD